MLIRLFFLSALINVFIINYGQKSGGFKGIVIDSEGRPVCGAKVCFDYTETGTFTNLKGKFRLNTVPPEEQLLVISAEDKISREILITITGGNRPPDTFILKDKTPGIQDIEKLAGLVASDKSPVCVSGISRKQMDAKLGLQEFPEILKTTPSVYPTRMGGGFGDSRVNIRGFDSHNFSVMMNGIPLNDIENDSVDWGFFTILSDITDRIRLQYGTGTSGITSTSVGGTIHILTKPAGVEKGGNIYYGFGSDHFTKYGVTLSSGLTGKKWATLISFNRMTGNGYADKTPFETWSYYMALSKYFGERNKLALTILGVEQWHAQRSTQVTIDTYKDELINSIRYNPDWGYRNGQVYHIRQHSYHKPMVILVHSCDINKKLDLSTSAYMQYSTGGITVPGGINKFYDPGFIKENQPDIDLIADENALRGLDGSETILESRNNKNLLSGVISELSYKHKWLTLSAGIDFRYGANEHWNKLEDLLGGIYYLDTMDYYDPFKIIYKGDIFGYNYSGQMMLESGLLKVETAFDKVTVFLSGNISNKSYRRTVFLNYPDKSDVKVSDWLHFQGYYGKGGIGLNPLKNFFIFFNAGYLDRQPDFMYVFSTGSNTVNGTAPNEQAVSCEGGIKFNNGFINASLNGYYINWRNKSQVISTTDNEPDLLFNLTGINALHKGIELNCLMKPFSRLWVRGMYSIGDWRWMDNIINAMFFDENNNLVTSQSVYIKDLHVGNAAQTQAAAGFDLELVAGFIIGSEITFFDQIYSYFDPATRTAPPENGNNPDSWMIPSYSLLDANLGYSLVLGEFRATVSCNVHNLLDTEYIPDATDGPTHTWEDALVFYGRGRSWQVGLKFDF